MLVVSITVGLLHLIPGLLLSRGKIPRVILWHVDHTVLIVKLDCCTVCIVSLRSLLFKTPPQFGDFTEL